jgi:serine/threonine protein kinase/tetratricopeptide (TPR) repeat protein
MAMTGRQVHHYRIKQQLGSGGMGEVYLAEDTRLGRRVALKVLPASFQYDPDRRERFLSEARAASSLRSGNVASIYDIGEYEGASYIVMEYVEGELLSRKLERGPLAVCDSIDIAMQVADALDEAHNVGVIHRDIKSNNLMITERGLVKVLDFGLVKVIRPATSSGADSSDETARLGQETAVGMVVGTVSYMSPEQALGRAIDHRSDIFSLGVVSYEMLTGRLPFVGDSSTEVIDRIVHDDPPAVARFNYSVPHELERIIRKMIEKDANFRYQTTREIYIDLRNLRRDLDAGRGTTNIGGYPTEAQATMMLGNLPAQAGVATTPKLENAVAVITFSNITGEVADDWIGSGIAETVTADLKNVRGISVIGRERIFEVLKNLSTGQLGESDETLAIDIGRRLGARWIIVGGYQRIGEMIRITARAVDVETGELIKTVKIDGKIAEIFQLQDRIIYELSQGLNLELGTSEITEIEREETESVEAYESFSRGMMNMRIGSRDSLDRSIHLFEKATELDSNYAKAWAALAAVNDLKGQFLSIPELSYKAVEMAQRAIKLNPRLSHAHQWLGAAYNSIGRYDEAIDSLKEAIRLEPNNAGARASLARTYWVGKGMIDEGINELERSIELNPQGGYAYLQLVFLYTLRGKYERAEQVAREAIELQEKFISGREGLQIVGAHTRLGYVYYCQGRYDEALREYERELDFLLSSDHALRDRTLIELDQKMGAAYLRKGMAAAADRHFKRALKKFGERIGKGAEDPFTKYYVAALYALQGDADHALKYLQETLTTLRLLNTIRAQVDRDFDSIRGDPRFAQMFAQ